MMINNEELVHLNSLVQKAEEMRNSQNTTALKQYVTNNPELSVKTFHLTNEIKERLINYMASGDREKEDNIRQELEVLQAQLDILNEQGNILFSLLAEEIILSFLMMRQCDATYARHIGKYLSRLRKLDDVITPKEGFET